MRRCDGLHDPVYFKWNAERTGGTLRDVVVNSVLVFALRRAVITAVNGTALLVIRSTKPW